MARKPQGGMRNMTEGSPAGHILAFSLPLLAGNFLQQLYNMVDSWVVGNYVSDAALAAVGVGFPVIFMFTSLFMGISTGGTVVIAQFYGAGQLQRVRDAVDTVYAAFVRGILPITLFAVLMVRPLLTLLRVDQSAYQEAFIYLCVVCAGLMGNIGYNLNAGILNGLGNSQTTLLFLSISTVMNIVLDLTFVLVFHWGVFGVAFATILAQLSSWLFGLFYINRNYPEIAIHPFRAKLDVPLLRRILSIGLPAGIQMSLVSVSMLLILSKINTYGKAFTAGFNVGNKLDALAFLPTQSLSSAITAFVGQNIGAGREDRAHKGIRVAVTGAAAWTIFSTVLLLWQGDVLTAFFSPEPSVVEASVLYLKGIMPPYVLFAILFVLNAAMRGAGASLFPMFNVVASTILVRVPLLYFLANRFGPAVMFHSYGVGWAVGCAASVAYYLSGRWKKYGSVAAEKAEETL